MVRAKTNDGESTTAITAAQRILAILDAFDSYHTSLILSEISRRSGLTLTTTHRLVGELTAWGALWRDPSGRYSIGIRVLELGALAPHGLQLREVALPYLDDLHQVTRGNVHLAVREGHDVVYIESLRAADGVPVLSRLGGRWPLHATGTGQVLLAHAPSDVRDGVLDSPLKRFSERTITDAATLRSVLSEVRRRGHSAADSQLTEGAVAVAVPVYGPEDDVVAAVGVTVWRGRVSPQALVPALMAASRGISRAFGATEGYWRGGGRPGGMPRAVPPVRRVPSAGMDSGLRHSTA